MGCMPSGPVMTGSLLPRDNPQQVLHNPPQQFPPQQQQQQQFPPPQQQQFPPPQQQQFPPPQPQQQAPRPSTIGLFNPQTGEPLLKRYIEVHKGINQLERQSVTKLFHDQKEIVESLQNSATGNEEQLQHARNEAASLSKLSLELEGLRAEQEKILASFFDGPFGSNEEQRLELLTNQLTERLSVINNARERFSEGRKYALEGFNAFKYLLAELSRGIVPVQQIAELMRAFYAGLKALNDMLRALPNVNLPITKQDYQQASTLYNFIAGERNIAHAQSTHLRVSFTYIQFLNHKCYSSLAFFDQTLTQRILVDAGDVTRELLTAKKSLNAERKALILQVLSVHNLSLEVDGKPAAEALQEADVDGNDDEQFSNSTQVKELQLTIERMRQELEAAKVEAQHAAEAKVHEAEQPRASILSAPRPSQPDVQATSDFSVSSPVPVSVPVPVPVVTEAAKREASVPALSQDQIFENLKEIMNEHVKDQQELKELLEEGKKKQALDLQLRLKQKRQMKEVEERQNRASRRHRPSTAGLARPDDDPHPTSTVPNDSAVNQSSAQ